MQAAGNQSAYGIANATVGELAPNIPITLTNGTNITLGDLRGKPVVLWLVTTWCSSCQEGEHILTSGGYYSAIRSKGANIVIIELYNDLGQPGPSIQSFAYQYGIKINVIILKKCVYRHRVSKKKGRRRAE